MPNGEVHWHEGMFLRQHHFLTEHRQMVRLMQLDESDGAVLVIGHNPGLHELAIALGAPDSPSYRALASGKFPTTARASFAVDASWAALRRSRHRLTDYVTAKSLGDKE